MTELDRWLDRVHCGDCLDVLRELPDCSVDLCATDPPYGIAFMARGWDQEIPARAIWAEVLRVLKPGASCFVCAGSRQDTILGLLTDLREVGFDIQHAALSWVYWNGFPKSTDVGKDFDKTAFLAWVKAQPLTVLSKCPWEHKHEEFRQRELSVECPECRRRVWALQAGYSNEITRADIAKAASAAVNGCADVGMIGTNKSRVAEGYRPTIVTGDRSQGTLLLSALQARFGDAPGVRAATGSKPYTNATMDAGMGVSGLRQNGSPRGAYEGSRIQTYITSAATPDAVAWDGWHSGSVPLKPSSEHILWVTKPAEPGPARNNVLKWGVGAVNVDECRVPFEGADDKDGARTVHGLCEQIAYVDSNLGRTEKQSFKPAEQGRYPSNLLVTARALGDDSRYGDIDAWAAARGISEEWLDAALSAGVLRVPKPSRSEKNAGCEGLDETEPPGSKRSNPAPGRELPLGKPRANGHPTCKPVTLFAFLCVLACPSGGIVLDPFLGSGTTAVAATQSWMHYIGIEREPEYVAIAEARIAAAIRDHQPTLAL